MSPQAEEMLLNQIVPRLKVLIPQSVSRVGHEDVEELLQDSTLMAIKMLTSAEQRGKKVTAGNIAHYTVLHARCGRRSYASGSPDVLHPINCLANGDPESLDYPVKEDEGGGESLLLADVMSNDSEDPAVKATRKIDWELFLATLNDRCRAILNVIAEGGCLTDVAKRLQVSASTINTARQQLKAQLLEFFGADILREIAQLPQWRNNLLAHRELLACRDERLPA